MTAVATACEGCVQLLGRLESTVAVTQKGQSRDRVCLVCSFNREELSRLYHYCMQGRSRIASPNARPPLSRQSPPRRGASEVGEAHGR